MADSPRTVSRGPDDWIPLPLDKGLFANSDPDVVVGYQTAIENGFVNELGGHTRFPGLEVFAELGDNGRVYLSDFEGDLVAATSKGQVYRVGRNGSVTACTGVPVAGGRRVIAAPTNQEMLFAAGGPIVRLRGKKTENLSDAAPNSAYIGYIDGYVLAAALNSQFCFYSNPGAIDQWPALNTLAADSNADNINCLLIDPFREIQIGGAKKFEQWERLTTGSTPFFRRWAIGDGAKLAYCILFADNAIWTINSRGELVRFSGQVSANAGGEIGLLLESIDDWTDAWMGGYPIEPLHVIGQKFILIQAPNATNEYGTKGVTICYDYRSKKFFTLYGFDPKQGLPTRWPGWSHWPLWGDVFVGGEGKIYRLTTDTYTNDGVLQRWLVRTAHISQGDMMQIKNFRLQLKRGLGTHGQPEPRVAVRCRRDAGPFGPWNYRDLGQPGKNIQFKQWGSFGTATTFMFEIMCSDNVPIDLVKAEVIAARVGH
jgi:hypothetical protein